MFSTIVILQYCTGKHHVFQNICHILRGMCCSMGYPKCSRGLQKKMKILSGFHCEMSFLVDTLSFRLSFLLS